MKKKGFTLIEIIISIAILSVIATIGVVSFNKINEKKEKEQKETFVENIKLETAIYFETTSDIKFKALKVPGDSIYIQLKDLVASGLLKEETYNPYLEKTIKDFNDDLVEVYLNEDNQIDIKYPTKFSPSKGFEEEKISALFKQAKLVIKENNDEHNKVVLPDSFTVYNKMLEEVTAGKYTEATFNEAVRKGKYYTFEDPGYKLVYMSDQDKEIHTDSSDWCIEKKWDNTKKEWNYKYEICPDSDIWDIFEGVVDNKKSRNPVKLVDNSAPVIIENLTNNTTANIAINAYYYEKTVSKKINKYYDFSTYQSKTGDNTYSKYFIYDNLDGRKGNLKDKINELTPTNNKEVTKQITLLDEIANKNIIKIKITPTVNKKPTIVYNKPTKGYYLINELKYKTNANIEPIYNSISVTDDIDNNISVNYELSYIYNEYVTTKYSYKNINSDKNKTFQFGKYKLNIKACDQYDYCEEINSEVIIRDNDTQKIKAQNNLTCDSQCIKDKMISNVEKTGLHSENQQLSKALDGKGIKNYYDSNSKVWCLRNSISDVSHLLDYSTPNNEYDSCILAQMQINGDNWGNANKKDQSTLAAANQTLSTKFKEYKAYSTLNSNNGTIWCKRISTYDKHNSNYTVSRLLDYSKNNTSYNDLCVIQEMKNNGTIWSNNSNTTVRINLHSANTVLSKLLSYKDKVYYEPQGSWCLRTDGIKKVKGLLSNTDEIDDNCIREQMRINGRNWTTGRDDLVKANEDLSKLFSFKSKVYKTKDGAYWCIRHSIDSVNGLLYWDKDTQIACIKDQMKTNGSNWKKGRDDLVKANETLARTLGTLGLQVEKINGTWYLKGTNTKLLN